MTTREFLMLIGLLYKFRSSVVVSNKHIDIIDEIISICAHMANEKYRNDHDADNDDIPF